MNISIIDILFCSLFCTGLHGVTRKLSIWSMIAYDKNNDLRSPLFEPIADCLTCMSSLWGSVYFVYINYPYGLLLDYLTVLVIGLCVLVFGSMLLKIKPLILACYFALLATFLMDMPYLTDRYIIFVLCVAGCNYIIDNFLLLVKNSKFRL